MLKTIRQKVATSISEIDNSDDFVFSKWLRVPVIDEERIDDLYAEGDPQEVAVKKLPQPLSVRLKFILQPFRLIEVPQEFDISKVKTNPVFFNVPRSRIKELSDSLSIKGASSKSFRIPIDFEISISSPDFTSPATITNEHKQYLFGFIRTIEQVFSIKEPEEREVKLLISPPEIKDQLQSLIPTVYNIELLNEEKLVADEDEKFQSFIDEANIHLPKLYKVKVPSIDNLDSTVFNFDQPLMKSINLNQYPVSNSSFSPPENFIYDFSVDIPSNFKTSIPEFKKSKQTEFLKNNSIDEVKRNYMKMMLSETIVSSFSKENNGLKLKPHEESAIKFLETSKYSLLGIEPGCGKFVSGVTALRKVVTTGKPKRCLIVSDEHDIGESSLTHKFGEEFGWEGTLASRAPELKNFIAGKQELLENEQNYHSVTLASHHSFIDAVSEKNEFLKNYDLLLLDGIEKFYTAVPFPNFPNLNKNLIVWLFSDSVAAESIAKVEGIFNKVFKLSRHLVTKDDIKPEGSVITRNYWTKFDELQNLEYSESKSLGREEIRKLIENLNPFRFQANIFTLLHKLKLICNFASLADSSPKSDLLLKHISEIISNKRKVLVLTQYDKLGLKKIEGLLKGRKIPFLTGQSGMSSAEIKESLKTFYNDSKVGVYLSNLKLSRLKIESDKIDYVIQFDSWWNPVSLWQLEDELTEGRKQTSPVFIYNYFLKDSFEETIEDILRKRELKDKNLFEHISSEAFAEFISIADWMTVFNLQIDELDDELLLANIKKWIAGLGKKDLEYLVLQIFQRLGFRNLEIVDIIGEPAFYLVGSTIKEKEKIELHCKCISSRFTKVEQWNELSEEKGKDNRKKSFVVSTGAVELALDENINVIDHERLAKLAFAMDLQPQSRS